VGRNIPQPFAPFPVQVTVQFTPPFPVSFVTLAVMLWVAPANMEVFGSPAANAIEMVPADVI
jgi:hypothetical protein